MAAGAFGRARNYGLEDPFNEARLQVVLSKENPTRHHTFSLLNVFPKTLCSLVVPVYMYF